MAKAGGRRLHGQLPSLWSSRELQTHPGARVLTCISAFLTQTPLCTGLLIRAPWLTFFRSLHWDFFMGRRPWPWHSSPLWLCFPLLTLPPQCPRFTKGQEPFIQCSSAMSWFPPPALPFDPCSRPFHGGKNTEQWGANTTFLFASCLLILLQWVKTWLLCSCWLTGLIDNLNPCSLAQGHCYTSSNSQNSLTQRRITLPKIPTAWGFWGSLTPSPALWPVSLWNSPGECYSSRSGEMAK